MSLIVSVVYFPISSVALLVRMVASSSFNPTFKSDICLVSQSGTRNGDCARTTRVFFCLVLTVREKASSRVIKEKIAE